TEIALAPAILFRRPSSACAWTAPAANRAKVKSASVRSIEPPVKRRILHYRLLVPRPNFAEHQQQGDVIGGLEHAAQHERRRHRPCGKHDAGERGTER